MSIAALIVTVSLGIQGGMASMRTIDRGTHSNVDDARTVAVRSPDEWAKVWRAHAADKPPPAVDFSKEMVVGVFLGARPTAGYGVEIVGMREESGALVVQYRVASPDRDMMTAQVITMPYHLVAIPTRAGEVRFQEVKS